jgi:hypothetical protein
MIAPLSAYRKGLLDRRRASVDAAEIVPFRDVSCSKCSWDSRNR